MDLWHLQADTPRVPLRASANDWVTLHAGTWPIGPGQSVWVAYTTDPGEPDTVRIASAVWWRNDDANSYWRAEIGPFPDGTLVRYQVWGKSADEEFAGPAASFRIGPKLHLALLWHQHQPLYKDTNQARARGSYPQPWVRLHATRDYYSMAALVAEHPNMHLTINLTPVLLWQIEEYVGRGATDRALELTRIPAESLTPSEQRELLATFFEADWNHQIIPHARYAELFAQQQDGVTPSTHDLRDLQMWFNLAWFGKEFRDGAVVLATGETASVRHFVEQQHGFTVADIEAMLAEQMKIMRAIVPLHRALQDAGQIEIATTPFYHPILPLLIDSDMATIDRPGATWPARFSRPEDARAQLQQAAEHYEHCFGRPPRGMWPAEGAVSQSVVPLFAETRVSWIASDGGVLARSGEWGYRADDPDVLCQPYRVEEGERAIAIFFRDAWLADHIGFHYQRYGDYSAAAREFLSQIKERFARRVTGEDDRVLTVVLDGENAWGAYRDDARPFLHALYGLLEGDAEVRTVTLGEYLTGDAARGVRSHPVPLLTRVYRLATGSWIDEMGSAPGVDLGTWIGEAEENRGWELLREARDDLEAAGATPASAPGAFEALYAAEGSDWFWWFGDDQDSGNDALFDDLFRMHLANTYRARGAAVPERLAEHIVPRSVTWTKAAPVATMQPGDRLIVRTNCPATLTWWLSENGSVGADTESSSDLHEQALAPVGGVMAGLGRHQAVLGPFGRADECVSFVFRCQSPNCDGLDACCRGNEHRVRINAAGAAQRTLPRGASSDTSVKSH